MKSIFFLKSVINFVSSIYNTLTQILYYGNPEQSFYQPPLFPRVISKVRPEF